MQVREWGTQVGNWGYDSDEYEYGSDDEDEDEDEEADYDMEELEREANGRTPDEIYEEGEDPESEMSDQVDTEGESDHGGAENEDYVRENGDGQTAEDEAMEVDSNGDIVFHDEIPRESSKASVDLQINGTHSS